MRTLHPFAPSRPRRAVTVLELLIAVSLVSFIILSLYQMFDRTQAQMRRAVREVDKFEGGRSAAELVQRDISQMTAGNLPAAANFYVSTNRLYSSISWTDGAYALTNNVTNTVQQNVLHELFFVTFDPAATPTNWQGISYRVADRNDPQTPATNGLGTLWRWSTNANRFSTNLHWRVVGQLPGGQYFQRVADNVVHFRVTAITNGSPVGESLISVPAGPNIGVVLTNAQLPGHVEVELGYVDSRTAERARGFLPNTNVMRANLSTNLDAVQMFRLHIPIRPGLQ